MSFIDKNLRAIREREMIPIFAQYNELQTLYDSLNGTDAETVILRHNTHYKMRYLWVSLFLGDYSYDIFQSWKTKQ